MIDNGLEVTRVSGTLIVGALMGITAGTACRAQMPLPTPPITIRVTTGLPGMTFKPLGEALVQAYARVLPDLRFEVVETAGSVSNLHYLQRGDAELGLALSDVTYMAFNGRIPEFEEAAKRVRAMAVLHPSVVHVLVPGNSAATSISQLRGRIGVGPPGSGTAVTSALLLRAFNVPAATVEYQTIPFIDSAEAVAGGRLDAAFVVAADPVDAVLRATRGGAKLLDVSGPIVQRLRTEYPFLRPGSIPGGTYPGEARAINTLQVDVLLLCRDDLDEALVRRLTNALFEVLPMLANHNDFLRLMDLQRAPATPIALHPGAALYYRERELSR